MTGIVLLTVNVHGIGPEAAEMPEAELFGRFAHGRYTYRVGLRRLLDMLGTAKVKATFFWPVFEAERCRALLERCLADGHEVAAHGNAFEDHAKLGDQEAALLEKAHARLTALAGVAPLGFRSATGSLSPATIGILDRLGYAYDSSFLDDDAPYSLARDGGPRMVELPYAEGLSDATHFRRRLAQDRAEAFFVEELDALVEADGFACLTLHPRADIGVGRAARLIMVERLLTRIRDKHRATLRLCRDVALACRQDGTVVWNGTTRG
jgi:peptidoglycan-N-acetylglucosamine deacetylase